MLREFKSLQELMIAFKDPKDATAHFASIRWRKGRLCPYCGHDGSYVLKKNNYQTYRCKGCVTNYSVTVGTIFEDSKLPLRIWFGAMWLIANHKKGIASTQLATDLAISQKSAWFLLHRLRYAAKTKSFNKPLEGIVEVDETYIGGKGINKRGKRSGGGSGPAGKTPVIGAIQRGGELVTRVLKGANKAEMQGFIQDTVSPDVKLLVSDQHPSLRSLTGYPVQSVNHSGGKIRQGDAHTNTIENVWALLKRQIIGTHHWVSPKHLDRYVSEMTWRFNRRAMTAQERVNAMFSDAEGRLTYKALIS